MNGGFTAYIIPCVGSQKFSCSKATEDLPQFTNEALSTSRQISGIDGDEVIRRFTLFPLPASEQKHLSPKVN